MDDSLFKPDDRRELIGTIVAVRHHNPQDGWTVARVQVTEGAGAGESCAAVGCIANAREGMEVKLRGQWVTHPVYGEQFRFDRYELQQPLHAGAIQRALQGGLIKGIGPITAELLVEHFGEDLLRVLDEAPGKLQQVPGIGPKRAKAIAEGWQAYRESDTQRTLMRLQGMDISSAVAIRIFKQYGEAATAVVENNPYQLAIEVDGIGFKTADRIARAVGTPRSSPFRLQAGISYALQEAAQQGHCYLPRERLIEYAGQLLECEELDSLTEACDALLRQKWAVAERLPPPAAAEEAGDHPMQAIYLPRLWKAEQGTGRHLSRIMKSEPSVRATGSSLRTWLGGERRVGEASLSPQQAEAVRLALTEKVVVLTGGPGVGKTTVTHAIVEVFEDANCRVLLASPTGRASKRLSEVTGRSAKTIHRLLEIDPKEWVFRRNENNPLEGDVVIVDEASMIDIDLMYALTRAVPDRARLILVGDVDQLPSVGPGLVLRDLIDSKAVPVARLTEIFRQDRESQIVMNAYRVNAGQQPVFNPQPQAGDDCVLIQEAEPEQMVQRIVRIVGQELRAEGFSPWDIQVLTPMNKRNLGTQRLNGVLQQALNPRTLGVRELRRGEKLLREGDRVVQTVNNYEKGVFNGDIGTIVGIEPGEQKVSVQFADVSGHYVGQELDELELAYALTVHKAQGSEYPAVVLVCHTSQYVMLQRNLLYTGLTRARRKCVFIGNRQAILVAVRNNRPTRRYTRLKELL